MKITIQKKIKKLLFVCLLFAGANLSYAQLTYDFTNTEDGWSAGNTTPASGATASTYTFDSGNFFAFQRNGSYTATSGGTITVTLTNNSNANQIRLRLNNGSNVNGSGWISFDRNAVNAGVQVINITSNGSFDGIANQMVLLMRDREGSTNNVVTGSIVIDQIVLGGVTESHLFTGNGDTDSDWGTAANWNKNTVPGASDNVVIQDLTNDPIIGDATGANFSNLIVATGSLTIAPGGSLMVSGTSTGSITYERQLNYVAGDLKKGWHLISSPVVGENYNTAWYTANDIATGGGGPGVTTRRGIASYTTATDDWSYAVESDDAAFTDGVGYIMKRGTATGVVSFTGTLNVSDPGASVNLTAGADKFHAVGNPYPSYMSSATFLGNAALSETQEIYVFDQAVGANGGYTTKTFGQDFTIAPGQGFFVKGNASGGSVTFAKSNQMTGSGGFLKSSKTEIKLTLKSGSVKNYAQVYYLDNATTGFDNGYEGETFGGIPNDFEIFTHLIDGNQGKNYQVQSLPNSDLETMVIPLGIKTAAGKITFTAEALNLPTDIKVFLEDRANNVFTRLDEANSNYEVTLSEAINGVGRFYLHTSAKSSLSVDNIELQGVSIFKSSASTLKIAGLQQGKASVSLFNIQGKQILSSSFNANGVKEISLPRLATGVYFVQLTTEKGKLNKKIILE